MDWLLKEKKISVIMWHIYSVGIQQMALFHHLCKVQDGDALKVTTAVQSPLLVYKTTMPLNSPVSYCIPCQ